jgi:hypothetical protein
MTDAPASSSEGVAPPDLVANAMSSEKGNRGRGEPTKDSAPRRPVRLEGYLLPWWLRLALTALLIGAAFHWYDRPFGVQLGWALQFGLLLAVSIVASCWYVFGLLNLGIAALDLWVSRKVPDKKEMELHKGALPTWSYKETVRWGNRLAEHIEVLATWIAVALVWTSSLLGQVAGLALLGLWGKPIINELTHLSIESRAITPPAKIAWWRLWARLWSWVRSWFSGTVPRCHLLCAESGRLWRLLVGEEAEPPDRVRLFKERRRIIYLLTIVGLTYLVLLAPYQWRTAFPLAVAVLVGLAIRWTRYWWRQRLEAKDATFLEFRRSLAELHYQKAKSIDLVGMALVAAAFGGVMALSLWERHALKVAANDENDGPPPPADRCVAEPGGPRAPDIAMFLLGDTHLHELGGYRFPGQMEVADSIMSVSRRPVELDLLSSASIVHFEKVYTKLQEDRTKRLTPLPPAWWAHLGDFANLSCQDEMVRALKLVARYSTMGPFLAGLIPGSHDMSFQGNFDWSPYWRDACQKRPMDKTVMDPMLERMMGDRTISATQTVELRGLDPVHLGWDNLLARFSLTRLGDLPSAPPGARRRGVLGVFFDTTDRRRGNWGIAGAYGTFSGAQADAIRDAVRLLARTAEKAGDATWADPWFVLLGHSPYAELTEAGKEDLAGLIADLDCGPKCGNGAQREPRVLALLVAHVHTAGTHRHCLGNRLVREIVIGSTLDPPQQAALLEIGLDQRNHAAVRVSTLPTVERPGFTCGPTGAVASATCRRVVAELAAEPACADLLHGWRAPGFDAATCEELERPLSFADKLRSIAIHGGPPDPDAIDDTDSKRGRRLLQCLCRDSKQPPPACREALAKPLDDRATAPAIEALARRADRADEVTCLAWAASAVQRHKAAGMGIAEALRCSFDDPTLEPAQVTTASSEEVPCY